MLQGDVERWGLCRRGFFDVFRLPILPSTKKPEPNLAVSVRAAVPLPASLRENSSYDVLCWATDAIGNDIMQSMVMLPLPWADTRDQLQILQVEI